mgnify:CR=1 FL=1
MTRSPLLPNRSLPDFFVCDVLNVSPKSDIAGLEHPLFSLSTKADKRIRRYEAPNSKEFIEITPSVKGLATVHDRDILIFCISQCIAALNEKKEISKTLRFKAYDLLVSTNRPTGGESYLRLREALDRLIGTRITTNIATGNQEVTKGFGLIESYEIIRETSKGRMQDIEITVADWVFNAIEAKEVLTLNRNYFRLRKSLERRLYEIARKHCGRQTSWKISLELLKSKTGSSSTTKEFRRLISKIVKEDNDYNHMPDYSVSLLDNDLVEFRSRNSIPPSKDKIKSDFVDSISLKADTYHKARLVAPGWDVYVLEDEWRDWMTEPPRDPDAAFIGFCRKVLAKRGTA